MGMEHVPDGTLSEYIDAKQKNQEKVSDIEGAKIMQAICKAVAYFHDNGVIHRDLKTANILLKDRSDLSSIKIIDFGLCERQLLNRANTEEQAGTLIYMAPEVAMHQEYTKSVDIWALGIIMHLLLTGDKHPYYKREVDNTETFKKKLSALKIVEPDKSFSWIAKNLF